MNYDLSKTFLECNEIKNKDLDELYFALTKENKSHAIRVSIYGSLLYKLVVDKNSYPEDKDIKKAYTKYILDAFRYHDIGKVIPVLDKKCKMSNSELEDKHPVMSNSIFAYLLDDYDSLSRDKKIAYYIANEAAIGHHENWIGNGYPGKKKGLSISIFARICRIANDYDNLTAKDKLSHSDAMKKIIRGKGDKYDPKIVDILKSIDKKFAEINHYINEERIDTLKPSKIYSDETLSNILLGKKGRIRNGMLYNDDLFNVDELRPIELLFNKVIDIDSQAVPFVESHVIINSATEGTLFEENYEYLVRNNERFEKLNKWGLTEISTIHESWELKFQRDVKFLLRISANTLLNHEVVADFVNFLSMINVDANKVAFEIGIEDVASKEDADVSEINESMKFLKDSYGYEFILNGINKSFPSYDILMQYDFDYIKVDYRLYRNYDNRSKVVTLIEKLNDMCRDLGTKVIITNIREKGEAKLVNECGIGLMSGPYFGELVRKPSVPFFKVDILD